ncbi:MAG: protein-L-isoaspartate(D-aspartate) O-methyltransferase [Gemmatimonadota bacterium]|nr:MAG: protein-L-isoaspartate(D-aspartate) O-methyltransferase [Gemmatimonadota bacterium]
MRETGVSDLSVLHAFYRVPRHLFVPDVFEARAYADEALPLGQGQTISKPSTHALFLQSLSLSGDERVLEIGTGSGFQTALLATLCERVFSIECMAELAGRARARIEALGLSNVVIRVGDGTYGWRTYAPFDAILVAACAEKVPEPLVEQLRSGGQLLIPVGGAETQTLHRLTKEGEGTVKDEVIAPVRFVGLRSEPGDGEVSR